MPSDFNRFSGSIPDIYERWMVPLLFAAFAADAASRVAALGARDVLETAAGTGVVSRALAAALPSAAITATDLNQPMLDRAATVPGAERVMWRQADALALPFADASFDAVVCQFGVMFFPDRASGHLEARRVLRPGGTLLFSVWDALIHNPFTDVVQGVVDARHPGLPSFFRVGPHGYHDPAVIRADLAAGGFDQVTIETTRLPCRAASAQDVAVALCQGTPMRAQLEPLEPDGLGEVTAAAAAELARRFGAGPIESAMQALVVTARAAA